MRPARQMHASCELVYRRNYYATEDRPKLRENDPPTEGTVGLAIGDLCALLCE
jgi:hypothetical protein